MSRNDPTGKRALFTGAASGPARPERDGKAALFSSGPARPGTVLVECSNCRARSRVTLYDLTIQFLPFSLWYPLRRHAHWIRCPACDQRQWCRIGWLE